MITGLRSHELRRGDIALRTGDTQALDSYRPLCVIMLSDAKRGEYGVYASCIMWMAGLGWRVYTVETSIGSSNVWTVYNREG